MMAAQQMPANPFQLRLTSTQIEDAKREWSQASSNDRDIATKAAKSLCEEFMKTEEYKSGDKDYFGYVTCCDMMAYCGGVGAWVYVLIVIGILICLSGSAGAFFFFYFNRKRGGRDEEKDIESSDNIVNTGHDTSVETDKTKSEQEISVETY
ncbi:hypothetical protein CRE_14713 [Caenorhabditis remanei]|uniref:Uncharacterized protein n=1 Tax=Caenorhabditis remanei TaxID=31234 RepID=E3M9P9_CAERE|nr:hypothetical protein CRE_14713 [Caenorhabditis remanei]